MNKSSNRGRASMPPKSTGQLRSHSCRPESLGLKHNYATQALPFLTRFDLGLHLVKHVFWLGNLPIQKLNSGASACGQGPAEALRDLSHPNTAVQVGVKILLVRKAKALCALIAEGRGHKKYSVNVSRNTSGDLNAFSVLLYPPC